MSHSIHQGRAGETMGEVHLSLPFPISTNRLYRAVGRGSILSEPYRKWKALAAQELMLQRAPRLKGRVKILVSLVAPDKRKRDADNSIKSLFDALVSYGVIEGDDNSIIREHTVGWSTVGSPCVVTIIPVGEPR